MSVLVLDPRWPDMVPINVAIRVEGPIAFTDEVPVSARWNFGDLVRGEDATGQGWLVTTDPGDPAVRKRLSRGEPLIEVTSRHDPINEAQRVMHVARSRGEWERAQTHESLLTYLEQESAEFAEAVRTRQDDAELKKELSDLLLQVLFHAEIADQRGAFTFADVAQAFVDKLKNRAPYLFDGSTGTVPGDVQDRLWAEGKKRERSTIRD
ncbi:XTP/dITP diphosphohydrolase [Corynebacterium mycetoides]|uniref:XTP/dITP diphosphohydrolase n=1 Tax=Corynebacterium mycetoides TaxID=38302 RepID=A0A1G9NJE9_9CORY|nr:MazG nucleotide pyrophosphohydrolase domain-containing protein [Corynebacterium mycetoides]SDL86706.1 XTP/dITP diphosphohydrolase [Corynebacterium mycetoides]